jgi:hypothetical protein
VPVLNRLTRPLKSEQSPPRLATRFCEFVTRSHSFLPTTLFSLSPSPHTGNMATQLKADPAPPLTTAGSIQGLPTEAPAVKLHEIDNKVGAIEVEVVTAKESLEAVNVAKKVEKEREGPVVEGMEDERLWSLMRRFNLVRPSLTPLDDELTKSITANSPRTLSSHFLTSWRARSEDYSTPRCVFHD